MYDRVLIRPSVAQLIEAFLAAQSEVTQKAALSHQRDDWEREAISFKAEPEGRRFWSARSGNRRVTVGVVWGTDSCGRRHFRIVGRPVTPTSDGDPFSRKVGPALLDLYPDACIQRDAGRGEWVVLCPCGVSTLVVSSPGWTGPRCHSCEQRGEPFLDCGRILDLGPGDDALVLPDASGYVVSDRGKVECRVADASGRTIRTFEGCKVGHTAAVAPDGRFLLSLDGRGRLRVHDLFDGRMVIQRHATPATAILFAPGGSVMAVAHCSESVTVYDWDAEVGVLHAHPSHHAARGLAWSGRGLKAVAGRRGVFVVNEASESPQDAWLEKEGRREAPDLVFPPDRAPYPTTPRFTPDGEVLMCLREDRGSREIVALSRWRWTCAGWLRQADVPLPRKMWAGFSPDGRQVASGFGPVEITDTATGDRLGAVGWPGGSSCPPRFTPDGRSLIVHHNGRMKVVPWALLLGVPA